MLPKSGFIDSLKPSAIDISFSQQEKNIEPKSCLHSCTDFKHWTVCPLPIWKISILWRDLWMLQPRQSLSCWPKQLPLASLLSLQSTVRSPQIVVLHTTLFAQQLLNTHIPRLTCIAQPTCSNAHFLQNETIDIYKGAHQCGPCFHRTSHVITTTYIWFAGSLKKGCI